MIIRSSLKNLLSRWLSQSIGAFPLIYLLLVFDSNFLEYSSNSPYLDVWRRGALVSEITISEFGFLNQWWRLWSAPLVHLNDTHLINNTALFLLSLLLGSCLLGWRGVGTGVSISIICYCIAIITFTLKSLLIGGWTLGFSGGVMGALGFVTYSIWKSKSKLGIMLIPLVASSVLLDSKSSDSFSHFVGFAFGLLFGVRVNHLPLSGKNFVIYLSFLLIGLTAAYSNLRQPRTLWNNWVNIGDRNKPTLSNGVCTIEYDREDGLYKDIKHKHMHNQRHLVSISKSIELSISTMKTGSRQITFGVFDLQLKNQGRGYYLICLGDVRDTINEYKIPDLDLFPQ